LAPVVAKLKPTDHRPFGYKFQHVYGKPVVTSDRDDAALTIDRIVDRR
jgi:hypothetical protein